MTVINFPDEVDEELLFADLVEALVTALDGVSSPEEAARKCADVLTVAAKSWNEVSPGAVSVRREELVFQGVYWIASWDIPCRDWAFAVLEGIGDRLPGIDTFRGKELCFLEQEDAAE